MTANKIQITEGALYPTLHALEKQGDLITEKVYIGKRVRKYYILTNQGKKTVSERVNELADFMKTMRVLLDLDSAVKMYKISDTQVDFILNDLAKKGILTEDVRYNILDHVCCIIENRIGNEQDFQEVYEATIAQFYLNDLSEIEEETQEITNI